MLNIAQIAQVSASCAILRNLDNASNDIIVSRRGFWTLHNSHYSRKLMKVARFCATCAMILLILEALFKHSAPHTTRNDSIVYLEGYAEHCATLAIHAILCKLCDFAQLGQLLRWYYYIIIISRSFWTLRNSRFSRKLGKVARFCANRRYYWF